MISVNYSFFINYKTFVVLDCPNIVGIYGILHINEIVSLSPTTLQHTTENITFGLTPTCQFDSMKILYQQSTCELYYISNSDFYNPISNEFTNVVEAVKKDCKPSK